MGLGVRGLASPHPIMGATHVVAFAALVVDNGGGICLLVLLVLFTYCVSFWCRQAQDARRLGGYGPEWHVCWHVLGCIAGYVGFALCSVYCRQARDAGIMSGLDQSVQTVRSCVSVQFLDKVVRCPFMQPQVSRPRQFFSSGGAAVAAHFQGL